MLRVLWMQRNRSSIAAGRVQPPLELCPRLALLLRLSLGDLQRREQRTGRLPELTDGLVLHVSRHLRTRTLLQLKNRRTMPVRCVRENWCLFRHRVRIRFRDGSRHEVLLM